VALLRKRFLTELQAVATGAVPKALVTEPRRNERRPLPCIDRDIFVNGLPREQLLAHPRVGGLIRSYPFQAGEPAEIRAAFAAALGLEDNGRDNL
jgi:5,5'-dehydrodivanillate O-demethylase